MSVTIRDIAKKAGVSIATVSRAIRPDTAHLVKPETRKRIQETIDMEVFSPNPTASNLVQKKTGIIGFTIPYFPAHLQHNDYFSSLVAGVMSFIANSQFELKFIIVPEGKMTEQQMRLLYAKRVDGLIISGWPTFVQFQDIIKSEIPLMIVNDFQENIPAHFVYADQFQGGHLLATHLVERGYSDFLVTSPSPEWFPDMDERIKGFTYGLSEKGITIDKKRIISSGVTEQSGYETMTKIIHNGQKYRAIFFINDVTAIGAIRALKDNNIKCPEEIAIVGFDNIRLGEYVEPHLTTIDQFTYDLGREAAQSLCESIERGENTYIRRKKPVKLIVRESCGA